jgi:hypothetical protein
VSLTQYSDSDYYRENPQSYEWRDLCVGVLLSIQHFNAAFDISSQYRHFEGMMKSALRTEANLPAGLTSAGVTVSVSQISDQIILRNTLENYLRVSPDMVGIVEPFPSETTLAMYCLDWLEKQRRYADLFEIGTCAPDSLETFLKVHITYITLFCNDDKMQFYANMPFS